MWRNLSDIQCGREGMGRGGKEDMPTVVESLALQTLCHSGAQYHIPDC